MRRRSFFIGFASALCAFGARGANMKPTAIEARSSRPTTGHPSLLTAPIELAGDWGRMIPNSALQVVERMRIACFDGVRLVSDDQPARLRVDEHMSGNPAVWLHADEPDIGWIIVDIGERDWSKLAYQFGHELGHVTCNSWRSGAKPGGPCQWLEEAMVEAFSLRGLSLLADGWSRDPPFKDDSGFGAAVAVYRQNIVERYGELAVQQGHSKDPRAWFAQHRADLEGQPGLNAFAQVAALHILAEYERNPASIEALGALNRWPGRSFVGLEDYIRFWEKSCDELAAPRDLPTGIRDLFGVN